MTAIAIDSDSKTIAALGHVANYVGYFVPMGHFLGPLLMLVMRPDDEFVREHAIEALNYQISWTVWLVISAMLCIVLIGIPMLVALLILDMIVPLVAAVRASGGEMYRYPLTIRFLS